MSNPIDKAFLGLPAADGWGPSASVAGADVSFTVAVSLMSLLMYSSISFRKGGMANWQAAVSCILAAAVAMVAWRFAASAFGYGYTSQQKDASFLYLFANAGSAVVALTLFAVTYYFTRLGAGGSWKGSLMIAGMGWIGFLLADWSNIMTV